MENSGVRVKKYAEFLTRIAEKPYITILHSGDMGDMVASLPVAKELFETTGKKTRYLLDTHGGLGINDPVTNDLIYKSTNGRGLKFNKTSFDFIKPLLDVQPYICEVREYVHDEDKDAVDLNMNFFRVITSSQKMNEILYGNLLYSSQIAANLVFGYKGPFITVPKVENPPENFHMERGGIVARSNRCHSSQVFLQSFLPLFLHDFKFVGTDLEYESFIDAVSIESCRDRLPHAKVANALEMAQMIDLASMVVVNSTLLFWIALGMEKPIIHELNSSWYVRNSITPDYRYIHYIRNDKYLVPDPKTGKIDQEKDLQEFFAIIKNSRNRENEKPEEAKQ